MSWKMTNQLVYGACSAISGITAMSVHMRFRFHTGGVDFSYLNILGDNLALQVNYLDSRFAVSRGGDGGNSSKHFTATAAVTNNEWVDLLFTSTNSVASSGLACYIDGTAATAYAPETVEGSGSALAPDTAFYFASPSSKAISISDLGVWNVVLTASDAISLASGASCLRVRPDALKMYIPAVRDMFDYKDAATSFTSLTGSVDDHPRVYGV